MICHFYSPHFLFQFSASPPAVQDSYVNLCFNDAGGGATYSSTVQSTVEMVQSYYNREGISVIISFSHNTCPTIRIIICRNIF